MYSKNIDINTLSSAEKMCKNLSMASLRYLREGGYSIYVKYDIQKNALVYAAVAKNKEDASRNLAFYELSCSISSKGAVLCTLYPYTAPLICYIHEKELNLSDEELKKIYGDIYVKIKETSGLDPRQAQEKIEMRDDFRSFITRLSKEETKKPASVDSKMNVRIGIDITDKQYAKVSITVITRKKENPVKDMYKFMTGFKTRDVYNLLAKENVILEGGSFVSPYNSVMPLLASLASFYNKSKRTDVSINYFRLLPVLDLLHDEKIVINGKNSSIKTKSEVSITVDDKGKPEFDPPFEKSGLLIEPGNDGVYVFDGKAGKIEYYPFQSVAARGAYNYFREKGVDKFEYIQDIFSKELLPKIASSVKLNSSKAVRPFSISLYISIDSKERLKFKTVYFENGEEIDRKNIKGDYAESIINAYLSVLKSVGGIEKGTLSDDDMYLFLKNDLTSLKGLCDLYCDDRLKPGGVSSISGLRVTVDKVGGYLDLTLDHDKYTSEELSEILKAYERKKKFFLLKNSVILLDSKELEEAESIFKNGAVHLDDAPIYHLFSLDTGNLKVKATQKAKDVLKKIKNFSKSEFIDDPHFKGELKNYQKEAVKYLRTISDNGLGAVLADEMGLGKTVEVIAYILTDKKGLHLVICPKAVVYNWESEVKRFSDLDTIVIDGMRDLRIKTIESLKKKKSNGLVVITSYDTFRRDAEYYEKIKFKNAFLDEAQFIKNAFSQRHKSLTSVNAEHRFALTGTPLENSQTDIWSIFDFLMPGYLRSLKEFVNAIGNEDSDVRIAGLVKPFILRRLKKDVIDDLPDMQEANIVVSMDETQRIVYLSALEKIREAQSENRIAIFAGLTRLRQLCVDPSVVFENYTQISSKLSYCKDLIDECIANGHKVIVFSSFKTVLHHFEEVLEESEISRGMITGDTSAKDRLALAETFNTTDNIDVMLVSLKAGGVGLNLIGADTVIMLDPWWNPSIEAQASGRAHRIGQKNNVTVYRLISKDSIEEKVQMLQQIKKELFDTIVEGTGGASSLSDEDIAFLIG